MADYTPPNSTSIAFTFDGKKYSVPSFDAVDFTFPPDSGVVSSIANLQASIEVMQLYRESTYSYIKECKTIVTGYSNSGIQTLKLPCLYGGIRDIGAYLKTQPPNFDLSANIYVLRNMFDLGTFQRATIRSQSDLSQNIKALNRASSSFSSFVRQSFRDIINLEAYTKFVRGYKIPKDLGAYLKDIQPSDIEGHLNIIELRNLKSSIEGVYLKGYKNLSTYFNKVLYRSYTTLNISLFGWATLNLSARITSFSTLDLPSSITAGFFAIHKNLSSLVSCISPVDLSASLQGYASFDLNAFTIMGYQPNDLQAAIHTVSPVNIQAKINAVFGIAQPFNLPGYIYGIYKQDLLAYIQVNSAKNLRAYIDAVGKYLNLEARIVPRTINIKRMLFIPLFEHKDLRATIQYSCQQSSYNDLNANIYILKKLDLKGYIIGWYSGTADNIIDLTAYINTAAYTTQNYIEIKGLSHYNSSSLHNISGGKQNTRYKTFNTYNISGGKDHQLLAAYVTGILNASNLNAYITAKPIANFTTLPPWINPKTHEVVINIKRFEERWTRFVEMMFFTNAKEDYHYFYVSGEDKIYKVNKNRTWQIHVTGYQEDTDTIYDRVKVNKKFIFSLDKYKTVDKAIRALMDRVTLYKSLDLEASITTYDLDYKNLSAYVKIKNKSSWTRSLNSVLKCITPSESLFTASIQPFLKKDEHNLTASIVGRSYEPPPAEDVKLVFEDTDYVAPAPYRNMNWTWKQAEKFWIYYEE